MLPVNRFYNDRDSYKSFGIQLEGLSLKNFNSFQPHFHKLADKNCKKYMTIYTICDSVGPANPLGPLELFRTFSKDFLISITPNSKHGLAIGLILALS